MDAREFFDGRARARFDASHPITRAKYASHSSLPYYFLMRERAALAAEDAATEPRSESVGGGRAGAEGTEVIESELLSRDGRIHGYPDYLSESNDEVVDYKTGPRLPEGISESEVRQLHLYAYLARENGIEISKGVIMRGDGTRASIDISQDDAAREAELARERLRNLNELAEAAVSFAEVATPRAPNCEYCPCIPFCDAFWRSADATWVETCGVHLQGRVARIETSDAQGVDLTTIHIDVDGGTLEHGRVAVEQFPTSWLRAGETPIPEVGDVIRVTHAHTGQIAAGVRSVRPTRADTAVWILPPSNEE
jgi:CRISPR/Cas system-associated exonuclease Cas4 (RecB family)